MSMSLISSLFCKIIQDLFLFLTFNCFSFISGNLEITVDYLVEIDKLVQLIESPIFACEFLFQICSCNFLKFLSLQL